MSDDHHDESEHEGIQPDSSLSYRAKSVRSRSMSCSWKRV